jgi:hypothetical protein
MTCVAHSIKFNGFVEKSSKTTKTRKQDNKVTLAFVNSCL